MGDIIQKADIAVDDTAGGTRLFPEGTVGRWNIWITNSGANGMFLGGLGVSDTGVPKGYPVAAGAPLPNPGAQVLNPENIYAFATVAAATTVDLFAMRAD